MGYIDLNAMLRFMDKDGNLQLSSDREAARQYFLQQINQNTVFFHSLGEKLNYLVDNQYYDEEVLAKFDFDFIKARFKQAYAYKFRFRTLMGALKYYGSYNLKTNDGQRHLERYEDRVVMNALTLSGGDEQQAIWLVDEIMTGRYQPATPTFLNAGRKQRGELVSCFLLRTEDNMESIGRVIASALQLSKRGGGVAINLTNLRGARDPIKNIQDVARGPVPVMKILEDSFSYADQLGQRQGAGAVHINVCHPDILEVLDTKRENADEKVRIKTLSLGVIIPDVVMQAAVEGKSYYTFSPYDVERVTGKAFSDIEISKLYQDLVNDERVRKTKIDARGLMTKLAQLQTESGYPYVMYEDSVNAMNPAFGRVSMTNLCTEILQVSEASVMDEDLSYIHLGKDISCNLGTINMLNVMKPGNLLPLTVNRATRALTVVSEGSNIRSVPSIERGNRESHAIGLGLMNVQGYLMSKGIDYDSPEALEFIAAFMSTMNYHSIKASSELASERGSKFVNFEKSTYATGEYWTRYEKSFVPTNPIVVALFEEAGIDVPTPADWKYLQGVVNLDGMYNQYRMAIAPNGSISYINDATASAHPVTAIIEERKEGKTGTLYFPMPSLTNENRKQYRDAYAIGPKALIDFYAAMNPHVDQGLSLTLFFPAEATTRDINRAQGYAWKQGIRTLYYVRIKAKPLAGTECEACLA